MCVRACVRTCVRACVYNKNLPITSNAIISLISDDIKCIILQTVPRFIERISSDINPVANHRHVGSETVRAR